MAPELLLEDAEASKEADMYAFGMVVYEVLTGTLPFGSRRVVALPMLTLQGSRPSEPEDPVAIGFGQGTWQFAERCWDEDPKKRPTARKAQEHFGCVARTSKVVDPGPTIPVHEPVNAIPERSSRDLCECHNQHSVSASALTAL
jgi:serine/threonine protein kinase